MASGLSTTNTANAWLNAIRSGGTTFTVVAGTFVQLHVGDPGASGTANTAAGSTTRVAVTQSAASAGGIAQNGTAPSWINGGTSETLSHVSVHTASSSGTFLYSIPLASSKAWASTDTFTLNTLGISLAPLAA